MYYSDYIQFLLSWFSFVFSINKCVNSECYQCPHVYSQSYIQAIKIRHLSKKSRFVLSIFMNKFQIVTYVFRASAVPISGICIPIWRSLRRRSSRRIQCWFKSGYKSVYISKSASEKCANIPKELPCSSPSFYFLG